MNVFDHAFILASTCTMNWSSPFVASSSGSTLVHLNLWLVSSRRISASSLTSMRTGMPTVWVPCIKLVSQEEVGKKELKTPRTWMAVPDSPVSSLHFLSAACEGR